MVRQLAAAGHEVYAADDYEQLAGQPLEVPRRALRLPVAARRDRGVHRRRRADRRPRPGSTSIVPAFEEAFYLSTQRRAASRGRRRSSRPVRDALARLHDKAAFEQLRRATSGCRCPRRSSRPPTPSSRDGDRALPTATSAAPSSRAAASSLLTNTGPLAGRARDRRLPPDAAGSPGWSSRSSTGETVCTYSTVHDGRVTSHLHVPDPAPVAPLDRDPVRVDRRRASRCG